MFPKKICCCQTRLTRRDHPYTSFLFYGTDTASDFIPVGQLCEKYNRSRHEASFNPDGEDRRTRCPKISCVAITTNLGQSMSTAAAPRIMWFYYSVGHANLCT